MITKENLPVVSSIIFLAGDSEHTLDIVDANGNRWVPSAQVGEALGNTNIRKLIAGLIERKELQEEKHICNLTLQMPNDTQPRRYLVLSYRGIIRVSMHSEGIRAGQFRDWAEDVLYDVMTTGCYTLPGVDIAQRYRTRPASLQTVFNTFSSVIKAGKSAGLSQREAVMSANATIIKVFGVDCMDLLNITEDMIPDPGTKKKMAQLKTERLSDLSGEFFAGLEALKEKEREKCVDARGDRALIRLAAAEEALREHGHRFVHTELVKALKIHPAFVASNTSHRGAFGASWQKVIKVWVFDAGKMSESSQAVAEVIHE